MPGAPSIQDTLALDGDGSCIAEARHRAVDFLTRVQAEHGLPVSARAMDLTQLVVSELVTNARKCVRRCFPEDIAAVILSAKRHTGIVSVVAGALMCLAGAVLYVMPGPGFPVLVLGLAALVIGLSARRAPPRVTAVFTLRQEPWY